MHNNDKNKKCTFFKFRYEYSFILYGFFFLKGKAKHLSKFGFLNQNIMGLLDKKIKINYFTGKITIEEIHKVIEEKLKGKYKIEFQKKGNLISKGMGAPNRDSVFISKNAYHRVFISVEFVSQATSQTEDETYYYTDSSTLKWWLRILNKEVGLIGQLIIRKLYGSADLFYNDINDAVKSKFDLKSREFNAGVSALWKK